MQIESIEIKNYRLFRSIRIVQIPRLCVLTRQAAHLPGEFALND